MNFKMKQQRKMLSILKVEDIKSAKLVREFEDDRIACADALINGVEVGLFWCGSATIGALEFWKESPKAKKKVFEAVRNEIETSINIMFDMTDADLLEELREKDALIAYNAALDYAAKRGKKSSIYKEILGYMKNSQEIFDSKKFEFNLKKILELTS